MIVIPAIDIKEGRCVRLFQGNYEKETEYSSHPVETALRFQDAGAERLHLVDLDAAVMNDFSNLKIITDICRNVTIPVEFGGGIRSLEQAEMFFNLGVDEIILGTVVIKNPDEAEKIISSIGSDRVQIGLDYYGEMIAIRGWTELVSMSVIDEIIKWKKYIRQFILTDVRRDGALTGPDTLNLKKIAEATGAYITASGGISSIEDIRILNNIEEFGINRIISGKAIYEKKIKLEEIFNADKENNTVS